MTDTTRTPPFCASCVDNGCSPSVCRCRKGCHDGRPVPDRRTKIKRLLGITVPEDDAYDDAAWEANAS
jgi:hypothetical protein